MKPIQINVDTDKLFGQRNVIEIVGLPEPMVKGKLSHKIKRNKTARLVIPDHCLNKERDEIDFWALYNYIRYSNTHLIEYTIDNKKTK